MPARRRIKPIRIFHLVKTTGADRIAQSVFRRCGRHFRRLSRRHFRWRLRRRFVGPIRRQVGRNRAGRLFRGLVRRHFRRYLGSLRIARADRGGRTNGWSWMHDWVSKGQPAYRPKVFLQASVQSVSSPGVYLRLRHYSEDCRHEQSVIDKFRRLRCAIGSRRRCAAVWPRRR